MPEKESYWNRDTVNGVKYDSNAQKTLKNVSFRGFKIFLGKKDS